MFSSHLLHGLQLQMSNQSIGKEQSNIQSKKENETKKTPQNSPQIHELYVDIKPCL